MFSTQPDDSRVSSLIEKYSGILQEDIGKEAQDPDMAGIPALKIILTL
jgi:hypothetical protein